MAKRFRDAFQSRMGIVHFIEILAIALPITALLITTVGTNVPLGMDAFLLGLGAIALHLYHSYSTYPEQLQQYQMV